MQLPKSYRPKPRDLIVLSGEPNMPSTLTAAARREWRRLVPLLLASGVLAETDGLALAALCSCVVTLNTARADYAKDPRLLVASGPNGHQQMNPLLSIIRSETKTLLMLGREFGLTPSSRSHVETAEPVGIDNLERLLCG